MTAAACGEDVDLNSDVSHGAFASINIKPDSSCVYSPDGASVASGLYDIAEGARSGSKGCAQPYRVHFLIESDVDESVLFQQATVTLSASSGDMLRFDSEEDDLPNPFEVVTSGRVDDRAGNGVVQVNAIPVRYAPYLADFVGAEVLIEAQMEGRTPSNKLIATQVVRFSVEICDGCLSLCSSGLVAGDVRREDFAMDECDDNAGADGRICWDPDC
ncbi:MAG TPA: hypothetical protein VK509_22890 [Polyangiales bacterium]|nr:hypothetical protein [Polyangiales bacterium]